MVRRKDPNLCAICGLDPECIVRVHHHIPFIDGKCYDLICFACYSVPKRWEYDQKTDHITCYNRLSPYHLHSVQEMMSDGWSKSEAEFAIKSVKKLLVNIPQVISPLGGQHVFECLSLNNMPEIEIEGWDSDKLKLKF